MKPLLSLFILSVIFFSKCIDLKAQQTAILAGQNTTRRVITTAVPFLMIAPDARSGAMGDAGAATSADAYSAHWNPAKFAFIKNDYGMSFSYMPWLGNIVPDMSISYVSGYYRLNRERTLAASLKYFDLGDINLTNIIGNPIGQFSPREFAIDITYSQRLTDEMSIGASGRYIHSNLTGNIWNSTNDAQAGTSVAVDLGWFYTNDFITKGGKSNIAVGIAITNFGQKMTYSNDENEEFIPTNLRIGSAYTTHLDYYNTLTIVIDFNKLLVPTPPVYESDSSGNMIYNNGKPVIKRGRDPDRSLMSGIVSSLYDAPNGISEELQEISWSLGMEYWYKETFATRFGYFWEHQNKGNRQYYTMGLGFRYNVFGIDFAYLVPRESNNPLAETLRLSLLFNFNTTKEQTSIIEEQINN